jgi:hypothetical protein
MPLLEDSSPIQREHPKHQNMKFIHFLLFVGKFSLPESGSRLPTLIRLHRPN